MALAILDLVDIGPAGASFRIDTGTNRLYQLKVGRGMRSLGGIDWVDAITYSTALAINENGGNPFGSGRQVALPLRCFQDGARYVQLYSYKSLDHRAPAFSDVVEVPVGPTRPLHPAIRARPGSISMSAAFAAVRRIPVRTASEVLARTASVGDVLGTLVKLAGPVLSGLLGALQGGASGSSKSSASPGSSGAGGPADAGGAGGLESFGKVLAGLLQSLLGGGGAAPLEIGKSLSNGTSMPANRFADGNFSRPFIFGVDDALIGMLAGPILQTLPNLLNSFNQGKLQEKQANNRLVTDLVSGINQRLMLQQLVSAGANSPAAASPDLAKLIQMLQQAAPAGAGAAAPATAQSLSEPDEAGATLSSRATVGFVFGKLQAWNGSQRPLFSKGASVRVQAQLVVPPPAPQSPLAKVIARIVIKDPISRAVLLQKTFKLKGVAANTALPFELSASELAPLPANRPLDLIAEMRWLTASRGEYKALGSSEIVLVGQYLLTSQGSVSGKEVELTDMQRFRAFWNKLWEAPVLDGATRGGDREGRILWELDADAKYSVLLSAEHDANGLMQTRFLKSSPDPESLTARTEGRMKGGIELSLDELNKLLPMWPGQAPLDQARLEALKTAEFAKANAVELVTHLKLGGRAGERGLVWAVPVFKLLDCTLSSVAKTDEAGQVTEVTGETVRFPLPVAVRLIGLKSHN